MEGIVALVTELGSFGLLLGLAGWIIYTYVKNESKENKKSEEKSNNIDTIKSILNDHTSDIKTSINSINTKVTNLETQVTNNNTNIASLSTRLDTVERYTSTKSQHTKQFNDRIKLGPQIHKTLNTYRARINADHVFIGSFHNGNESLTGIPYYKFDIIAERFRPDKVERDIEFAPMYKDTDLLRHDLLPTKVVQEGMIYYAINEDKTSDLMNVDDILYRRMLGRDVKQLAISLLRDPEGIPSGFIGCVRYDYESIDLDELKSCADELEQIYASNEKLISKKNK